MQNKSLAQSISKTLLPMCLTLQRADVVQKFLEPYNPTEEVQKDIKKLIKVKRKLTKLKSKEAALINKISKTVIFNP